MHLSKANHFLSNHRIIKGCVTTSKKSCIHPYNTQTQTLTSVSKVKQCVYYCTRSVQNIFSVAGGNATTLKNLDGVSQFQTLTSQGTKMKKVRNTVLVEIDWNQNTYALIRGQWKIVKCNLISNIALSVKMSVPILLWQINLFFHSLQILILRVLPDFRSFILTWKFFPEPPPVVDSHIQCSVHPSFLSQY